MPTTPNNIIFHHYWPSPVAQKVRTVLGIKGLDWLSVEIPRVPPKPKLVPLTGGYRRTPVMQIGADVYCDSRMIIEELERRHPTPTLFPAGTQALSWGLSRWTDDLLFKTAITVVLGSAYDSLPQDFADDRLRLYFGPDFDPEKIKTDVTHAVSQIRVQLDWLDQHLSAGNAYLSGDSPGLLDALAYYLVWFLRGRYANGPDLVDRFSALSAWEAKMESVGHGSPTDLDADAALAIAREATSGASAIVAPDDPHGLAAGARVAVIPEGDGGDPPVIGELVIADLSRLAVRIRSEEAGDVVVHFPRVGYRIVGAS